MQIVNDTDIKKNFVIVRLEIVSVKCAENHSTMACPRKTRSDSVKCVLCDGNHPANYKECIVYKQIQKAKYPPLRPKIVPKSVIIQAKSDPPTAKLGQSYAQTTKANGSSTQIEDQLTL